MCGLKSGSSLLILSFTHLIKHITNRVIRGLRPQPQTIYGRSLSLDCVLRCVSLIVTANHIADCENIWSRSV